MKKDYTIAVAGTGYVGLSIATLLSQHHKVMAVDIVKEKVDLINNRKSPIQDDYIEKYLAEKDLNLTATLDTEIMHEIFGDNVNYIDKKVVEYLKRVLQLNVKVIPTNTFGYEMEFDVQKTVGPKDWINLLYNAEFILTDSFHATAFSIIFNKNFYVLKRFSDNSSKSQNSRIYHLLNMTNLSNRIWKDDFYSDISDIKDSIWEQVNNRVCEQRELSSLWLKEALDN